MFLNLKGFQNGKINLSLTLNIRWANLKTLAMHSRVADIR